MEIPISNSVAPTEIVRVPRRFAVIYCHSLPTFWAHEGRRFLGPRIRIRGTIVPLNRVNRGPCRYPPKEATRGSRYGQCIKNAESLLSRKNGFWCAVFAVAGDVHCS